MATVNADSIAKKVKAYVDSSKGKQRMKSTLDGYIKKNVSETKAGSRVLTESDIMAAGEALARMIKAAANSSDIPASVASDIDSLRPGKLKKMPDGSYTLEFSFTADLSRPSLEPYKYGGVDNIVAIFNNGYPADKGKQEAIKNVWGYWHGAYIHALGYRQGLHFMQAAVNDFNANYGAKFNMFATLADCYK